jgi:uncharacterized repeat protein (TIGR01451 family)
VFLNNAPPNAGNDSYSTGEDTSLTVPPPGVLGNDSDADGDGLSAVLVAGPSNGTLNFSQNGGFTYTPNTDFFGMDSFTYRANDGLADSNTATVTITVTSAADADLALVKTDPPGRAPTGRNLKYVLTVTNGGPDAASGVTVVDQLPPSVTFVSATPTQGSCGQSGALVLCILGTIGSGGGASIEVVVKPTVPGTITNTASVSSSTADPNRANNSDSEDTMVCRITSRRSSIPCP